MSPAGPFALPGARASAAARGERNRLAGAAFEAVIEHHHRVARLRGLARVRKVSPAVRWTGRGPAARAKVVGENGCDYLGWMRGGRAFVAEAKATEDYRLVRSAFEEHQVRDLDEALSLGALAMALIEIRVAREVRRFAVPWGSVAWRERGGGASVGAPELAGWELVDGCYLGRWAA